LVDNFEKVIKEAWEHSDLFRKILKSDYVEKLSETPKIPTERGYYTLFPKEHFVNLKPFNEMPPISGTSSFGMDLARDKTKQILKKILENLKTENIYYYSDVKGLKTKFKDIVSKNKNYFAFGENLYKKGFEFDRGEIRDDYIIINGNEINGYEDFYDLLSDDVLLIEEGALKLIQYNALNDTKENEALHISVTPFTDSEEDKKLMADLISKDSSKSEDDLKLKVKVKIFERYEVKDIDPDKIWLFKKN